MGTLLPGYGATTVNPAQVYQYIVSAGASTDINGPGSRTINGVQYSQAEIMTAIAGAESTYDPYSNGDTTLSQYGSVGFWQLFTGAHTPKELGVGSGTSTGSWTQAQADELSDPNTNAAGAMTIYKEQGYSAWSTYNSGAYLDYLGKATTASYNASGLEGPGIPGTQSPPPTTGGATSSSTSSTVDVSGLLGTIASPLSSIWEWLKGGTERILLIGGGIVVLLFVLHMGG